MWSQCVCVCVCALWHTHVLFQITVKQPHKCIIKGTIWIWMHFESLLLSNVRNICFWIMKSWSCFGRKVEIVIFVINEIEQFIVSSFFQQTNTNWLFTAVFDKENVYILCASLKFSGSILQACKCYGEIYDSSVCTILFIIWGFTLFISYFLSSLSLSPLCIFSWSFSHLFGSGSVLLR